ncbi:30S ribosome-binding factor RbfA [Candidatus Erwinia haradaeae]|uniref:Ribosome-binding factor A n=1 Tax=Candidatus Erwinia haradaeae TaxID=1922217 RepID=A0A451DIA8_9GAMM|nr:30S ribosome-binding factor RbfA [Candidatus Erwinia haradaeae]VFP86404.1 30S ribosome-binding factor [Candidatus Erwinia haradaeae]
MAKEFGRLKRIAQEIKKEIAIILQCKIRDPRLDGMITVSSVSVSRDLAYAKVFVTFLQDKNEVEIAFNLQILSRASGYIRTLLSQTMNIRMTPKLSFYHDNSFLIGMRISKLVSNITPSYQEGEIALKQSLALDSVQL